MPTAAWCRPLISIPAAATRTRPDFTALNGELYFSADDGTTGRELWKVKTDGSVVQAADIDLGANGSNPHGFTVFTSDGVINGTAGSDLLKGTGRDLIHGLGGNDSITELGNLNTAFGDDGSDQLHFNGNQNQLFGSDGDDWLGINGTSNALVGGNGNEVWMGASGDSNTLDGQGGNDSLFAIGNSNCLHGGAGTDWLGVSGNSNALYGAAGNEWMGATGNGNYLLGGDGGDTLFSVGGNFLYGEAGDDWLGCSGNGNLLNGGAGNDYLGATGNNNTLDGGAGNDTLVAAAGHTGDQFVFQFGYGHDVVQGFAVARRRRRAPRIVRARNLRQPAAVPEPGRQRRAHQFRRLDTRCCCRTCSSIRSIRTTSIWPERCSRFDANSAANLRKIRADCSAKLRPPSR